MEATMIDDLLTLAIILAAVALSIQHDAAREVTPVRIERYEERFPIPPPVRTGKKKPGCGVG